MRNIVFVLGIILPFLCFAEVSNDPPLTDPQEEAIAKEIFRAVRCPVCEGQALDGSDAKIAKELRVTIRALVHQKYPKEEIEKILVEVYGEGILFEPPFNKLTSLLWLTPTLILIIGGFIIYGSRRRVKGS